MNNTEPQKAVAYTSQHYKVLLPGLWHSTMKAKPQSKLI